MRHAGRRINFSDPERRPELVDELRTSLVRPATDFSKIIRLCVELRGCPMRASKKHWRTFYPLSGTLLSNINILLYCQLIKYPTS